MPDLGPVSDPAQRRPRRRPGASGGAFVATFTDAHATAADAPSLRAILARCELLGDAWQPERPIEDGWSPEDDHRYRTLYEHKDRYLGSLSYEAARVAYRIGRLAARHASLGGGSFEEGEARLARGWDEARWRAVKPYVRLGFERCRFDDRLEESRRAVERLERGWHAGSESAR